VEVRGRGRFVGRYLDGVGEKEGGAVELQVGGGGGVVVAVLRCIC
jgi:hypothetical protein